MLSAASLVTLVTGARADTELSTVKVDTPRGTFVFTKYLGSDDKVYERVQDERGAGVAIAAVPSTPVSPISRALEVELRRLNARDARVTVDISLRDDVPRGGPDGSAAAESVTNQSIEPTGTINGARAGLGEFAADTVRISRELEEAQATRRGLRLEILNKLSSVEGLQLSGRELEQASDAFGPLVRTIAAGDVERLVREYGDLIAAIDLHQEGKDDTLATALADTSVDPGARQLSDSQGTGIGVYLTESGCPPAGFITSYTLLAGSNTDHSRNTTSILRAVSPNAWLYCRGPADLPTAAQLLGSGGNPRVHIVSRSNGSAATEYVALDRDWDNFTYDNAVIVSKSAGNNNTSGAITAPGNGLNMITVGNYNDATNTIAASSSAADPTNTRNRKPELAAPGENIDAGGFTMSGTSMAAPHVAGMLADAMQAYPWLQLRPAIAKSHMIAAATDVISGGVDAVGEGGADYLSGYYAFHDFWWWGGNGYFNTAADSDGLPGNGSVDVLFNFSAGQPVRVALAWPNRGTYTFDHRGDPHPIGIDLDLYVYAPNGTLVSGSASWDNPYEAVSFTAPQTGTYRVAIRRFANRDTAAISDMGLTINW